MDCHSNARLISFNCKSLKRSLNGVRLLCDTADVIALQETWLLPHELSALEEVSKDFGGTGTSAVDTSAGLLKGRPYGGVALLWRKSVFRTVTVINCDDVRLSAVKVLINGSFVIFFSVYMPTDCSDNLPTFTQCLSTISAIIEENSDTSAVYILGDFNAHPNELFCNHLLDFCEDQQWTCVDLNRMNTSDAYTFISEAHGCVRWLDHCVVTNAALSAVTSVKVEYDVLWSDHFPLVIECNLGLVSCEQMPMCAPVFNSVVWGDRTAEQVRRYHKVCHAQLREINFPDALGKCCDGMCSNVEHRSILKDMYLKLVTILSEAAKITRKKGRIRRRGGYVAGWNKYVAGYHREARLRFLAWVEDGKPKQGQTYVDMKDSRKLFKQQLKWCQDRQDQIKMDALASHHSANNFKLFWKETGSMSQKPGLPMSVNGISDHRLISNMFSEHFKVRPKCDTPVSLVPDTETLTQERVVKFKPRDVRKVLSDMQGGKSPGHDGLSVEHLRHAGVHLPRVLSLFYNLCLCHGYLPEELTRTIVVPVIKDRNGDASDRNNYRPISLATIIAKVLDSLLNKILVHQVALHEAQFGFRSGLSTESAILSLKQAVRYYTDRKTPVYACFLDLSRAFDTVLYDKLWGKLGSAGVPVEVIRLIKEWYGCQRNQVRWAGTLSDPYDLECGVRQGGLTSPLLFNLYVNDLIGELSSTHTGCHIDNVCVNNISYADDMVLLGPSVGAVRKLLGICEKYAVEHGLTYNTAKSKILLFKGKLSAPVYMPPILLCGEMLQGVTSFRYLGHIVTDDLSDDADLERERRALAVRGNMIARRFARCSTEVKITIFKAYCQSFYSCSLWVSHTRRAANVLRVQYNNIFRMLMRLPPYCSASLMFAEAHTDGYKAILRKRVASLQRRLRDSSNGILKMIAMRFDCPIQYKWIKISTGQV